MGTKDWNVEDLDTFLGLIASNPCLKNRRSDLVHLRDDIMCLKRARDQTDSQIHCRALRIYIEQELKRCMELMKIGMNGSRKWKYTQADYVDWKSIGEEKARAEALKEEYDRTLSIEELNCLSAASKTHAASEQNAAEDEMQNFKTTNPLLYKEIELLEQVYADEIKTHYGGLNQIILPCSRLSEIDQNTFADPQGPDANLLKALSSDDTWGKMENVDHVDIDQKNSESYFGELQKPDCSLERPTVDASDGSITLQELEDRNPMFQVRSFFSQTCQQVDHEYDFEQDRLRPKSIRMLMAPVYASKQESTLELKNSAEVPAVSLPMPDEFPFVETSVLQPYVNFVFDSLRWVLFAGELLLLSRLGPRICTFISAAIGSAFNQLTEEQLGFWILSG